MGSSGMLKGNSRVKMELKCKRSNDAEIVVTWGRCEPEEFRKRVERIRSLPNRRWDAIERVWMIPLQLHDAELLLGMFADDEIEIDPELLSELPYFASMCQR